MEGTAVDAILKIISSDLAAEDLQALTRELSQNLNRETEVNADLPEEAGGPGTRGGAVELVGQILLTALSSGTVAALFNILKSYLERKPSLEMEFQRSDGQKLRVRAEDLDKGQIQQTMKLANEFLRG
jgi:hypothetical protein